jgi:hypothetical protein
MIEPWNRSKTEPNGGFRAEPLALDNPYYRAQSDMAGDIGSLRANRRKAEAASPAIQTRRRYGCDADFRPARPWSPFCCPACPLWTHRRFAGNTTGQKLAAIFESDPRQNAGEAIIGLAAAPADKKTSKLAPFSDPKAESAL